MLRNFYQIKVSVNRLYDDVSHVTLRWRQLSTKQKKQAIELTHEWLVNFGLNSLLHTQ